MRLVHLDIDRFDADNSIHLGPLAAGLNAVCGPQSSGKTTISRFVRAMMYPNERTSLDRLPEDLRSSRGSMAWVDQSGVHRTFSHLIDEEVTDASRPYHGFWADRTAYVGSEHRAWDTIPVDAYDAIYSGRLGEISIDRLWNAAKRIGVQGHYYSQEQLVPNPIDAHRDYSKKGEQYWQNERQRLLSRLADLDVAYSHRATVNNAHFGPVRQRLDSVRSEISSLRHRERELVDAIADESRPLDRSSPNAQSSRRYNLDQLDRQLIRWRQTLEEIRSQREQLERTAHDIKRDIKSGTTAHVSNNVLAGLERLEEQVVAVRQQLADGDSRLGVRASLHPMDQSLPNILRKLQEDLYHVSEQLSRCQSQDAVELLSAQISQLKRCELELAESIDRQIQDRNRFTATVSEPSRTYSVESREQLCGELARIRTKLAHAMDECSRLESDIGTILPHANVNRIDLAAERAEVLRQLQDIETMLADLHRDPYQVRKARTVTNRESLENTLVPKADRYLRDLSGGSLQRLPAWAIARGIVRDSIGCSVCSPQVDHDLIRSSSHEERQLVELALRLAIIETARESHVCELPLILDNALESYDGELLDRVVFVLDQFAQRGHQVILLTRDEMVASRVQSTHGCVCQLRPYQSMNPVRYARQAITNVSGYVAPNVSAPMLDVAEINRRLTAVANDLQLRQQYTTHEPRRKEKVRTPQVASQYFLAIDSPIEQAPSLTPIVVHRLKNRGIYEVGQLMETEPHELVVWLSDLGVRDEDVRSWQSECDLMCHVPHLRAFDARVLVGCGITSPKSLRITHPNDLVSRVDAFLTTARGRDILRTASRNELSKLSNWLASAGRDRTRVRTSKASEDASRGHRQSASSSVREHTRHNNRSAAADRSPNQVGYPLDRGGESTRSAEATRSRDRSARGSGVKSRKKKRSNRGSNVVRMQSPVSSHRGGNVLRFYLDLESAIVDAPSIGDTMAQKLSAIGIRTVQQFLVSDAKEVASQLNLPRVSLRDIVARQQQATLVCRVPNLRGHDAQLLVAADIVTAEQLSKCIASELLAAVSKIANSKLGQRILRNSKAPDLAEVTNWINWSKSSRIIRAA